MFNDDIISMSDKWEYPCYAAWDLTFHTLPLASVDPDFENRFWRHMFRSSTQNRPRGTSLLLKKSNPKVDKRIIVSGHPEP